VTQVIEIVDMSVNTIRYSTLSTTISLFLHLQRLILQFHSGKGKLP